MTERQAEQGSGDKAIMIDLGQRDPRTDVYCDTRWDILMERRRTKLRRGSDGET